MFSLLNKQISISKPNLVLQLTFKIGLRGGGKKKILGNKYTFKNSTVNHVRVFVSTQSKGDLTLHHFPVLEHFSSIHSYLLIRHPVNNAVIPRIHVPEVVGDDYHS